MEIKNFNNQFEYRVLEDQNLEITRYVGNKRNVVIPSEILGSVVTNIGCFAFERNNLTKVTIPTNTTLQDFAFDKNVKVTKI